MNEQPHVVEVTTTTGLVRRFPASSEARAKARAARLHAKAAAIGFVSVRAVPASEVTS